MFIEKLDKSDVESFFKKQYAKSTFNDDVEIRNWYLDKKNELVVQLNVNFNSEKSRYWSINTFTLKDFEIDYRKPDVVTQLDYLTFMYEKFGKEYLYSLKEHLKNNKPEKVTKTKHENKINKLIDELTK